MVYVLKCIVQDISLKYIQDFLLWQVLMWFKNCMIS